MNEITTPAIVPTATEGNLTNLIAERAWFEPERVTMSRPLGDGWQPVTAREVEEEVRATAKGLVAAGIQIGDRVAIMARTRYEWTILDFAIWYAGGCVVPIYETSSAEQVDWILNDSGAVGLIVETPTHKELALTVLPSHTKHVWVMTEDVLSTLRSAGTNISDDEIDRRRNALVPSSLATLIYTSGTTGRPKGVQLTHSNFLSECGNVVEGASDLFLKPGGSTLHTAAIQLVDYSQIWLHLNQHSFLQFPVSLKRFTMEQKQRQKQPVRAKSSAKQHPLQLLTVKLKISAGLIRCSL